MKHFLVFASMAVLAACGSGGEDASETDAPTQELALNDPGAEESGGTETLVIEDIEAAGPLSTSLEGVTPMAERVAVLGLLNKRNGLSRELRLRPGESTRVGNVVIRLRACERTAPWEPQRLTGAFVQLFVRQPDGRNEEAGWNRVFSGWLYKERPSLNVVEHSVYDIWSRDCEMTYPGSAPSEPASPENSPSSAPRSAPPVARAPDPEGETEGASPPSDESAESSIDA